MMSSITTQFELKTQLVQGERRTTNFKFIFGGGKESKFDQRTK